MKKAIALLTAIALAAAAMSGCSGQGGGVKDSGVSPGPAGSSAPEDSGGILNLESQFPVTTEPVSMTIAIRRSEISGSWKEQWFWKWAEDKTKVAMDVQEYDSSAWPEKKQIMLATEELLLIERAETF